MKAKDLRTLEVFLAEYSGVGQQPVKPGAAPSGPVASGQQALDTADRAKAERDRKSAGLPKDDVNTDLRAKASAGELSQEPIDTDDVTDTTGSQVVKPPSGAQGLAPTIKSDKKSPTTMAETDKKIFKKKGAFGRSAVGGILKKKLPTGRLLKEADPLDFIVEINFNSKEVVKKALNGPVNCGFEAELIFPRIADFGDESMIDRIANSSYESDITELYRKTLMDFDNAYGEAFYEYQMAQMTRDMEDEDWVNDFVNYVIDDNDISDYKQETLDTTKADDPDEYEERLDWEPDAWGRELAELSYRDEMQDYWMENLDDYQLERLVNRFEDNPRHGIVNWMMDSGEAGNENWINANDYLEHGDDGPPGDSGKKREAYEEVEKWLFDWAKMNSHNADIEVGGYHETEGHDGWRIEEDSSLEGDGAAFEIISPVFDTPKDMLKEINSLFSYAQDATETNRSTGLHVTMSYAEPSDVPTNIAKTKMYVLSGADNQAKVWGREFNSYSQNTKIQVLKALRAIATGNASDDNIKTMDDMITQFDASGEAHKVGRQSTVNVKGNRNSEGNSLVEFRAAGGAGYTKNFEQIAKDVTRYSATVQASYDDDAYNKEFAKKMYKWLQDADDVEDPQAYSSTKGLSPQDVYRQSTGDTTTDVDNHPLTNYMMKFTHSTFQDGVKQAITRFFDSLRHQQEYAQKHNLNEYEENPEEVYADFKSSTREALTDLLVYLSLSANTDKMTTKELMAIRKLVRQHGLDADKFVKALTRDTGNPRTIPDPRDKADRTRIFKRGGKLIGKDIMDSAPEKMAIFVAPGQLALLTAESLRYIQQYGHTEDTYLPMQKSDYDYIQTEIQAINTLFDSAKSTEDVEIDTQVRKAVFDLTKNISTKFNRELSVDRVAMRASEGGIQYALTWQNQLARPHTDPKIAQNLKTLGVEVKPTEEMKAPFENLMSKFEGKSLQEQLTILNKLDKQKIDEAHKRMFVAEGSVPDTRKVSTINKLLSEHFPASDLQKQMEAFTAIPMPEMIDDFRSVRIQSGDDGCCRPVLKKYIKYMHPRLRNEISIKENRSINKNILNEAVRLQRPDLDYLRAPHKKPRYDAFVAKLKSGAGFKLADNSGEIKLSPDNAQYFVNGEIPKKLISADGKPINWNKLAKTGEFGGSAETATGERKMANRGNTLEGVLGAATVARLRVRPGRDVTEADIKSVIDEFAKKQPPEPSLKSGGGEVTFPAKSNKITDNFKLTVKLPMVNYTDFVDWNFLKSDPEMAGYIRFVLEYVNTSGIVDRFSRYFEQNARPDMVHVIADGVSDMTGRKTDIFMVYIDEDGQERTQRFDLSLKAGTTPQFGQAAAGGDLPTSKNRADSEYGWNAFKEIFGAFGVDLSRTKKKYLAADNLRDAVTLMYAEAEKQFAKQLAGSDADKEKRWLRVFVNNIKEHGTYNDPAVQLAQFEKTRYYVLDFQKLDRLFNRENLDLESSLTFSAPKGSGLAWPIIVFYDKNNPKDIFIKIRAKYDPKKMNNIIEKGSLLKKITKVRGRDLTRGKKKG